MLGDGRRNWRRVPVLWAALAVVVVALSSPVGEAAGDAVVGFARNAGKLGGFSPSKEAKRNTVVVRDRMGKIDPASLPTRAPRFSISSLGYGDGAGGTAVVIGEDGLPLIVHDAGRETLKVARCLTMTCSSARVTALGSSTRNGKVAIGADGLALIAFRDVSPAFAVGVAHCVNAGCASFRRAKLDTTWPRGVLTQTAITIGADGRGLIAYAWNNYPNSDGQIAVAHCVDVRCRSAALSRVDGPGAAVSVTTGADGFGLISYGRAGRLMIAHCENVACSAATTSTIDPVATTATSVAVGADGLPLVAYATGDGLKVAHCSNAACTHATSTVVDASTRYTGPALTIGSDGRGVVAYETRGALHVAHCSDPACSRATTATVSRTGFAEIGTGPSVSVTIGVDGMPLISFFDHRGRRPRLRVAHCSNVFCLPYFRRH